MPFHEAITRQFLLLLRGRVPPPGVPAPPALRLAGAAADVLICVLATRAAARRRRLLSFALLTGVYHLVSWWGWQRTPAALLTRQRLLAIDGSRPTLIQCALRLLAAPLVIKGLRARHDEIAGTDVVMTREV
jgi:hypothetical protein